MKKAEVEALFLLADIEILDIQARNNQYISNVFTKEKEENPWWKVRTKIGSILIGDYSTAYYIDWQKTPIRQQLLPVELDNDDLENNHYSAIVRSTEKTIECLKVISTIMKLRILQSYIDDDHKFEHFKYCVQCHSWKNDVFRFRSMCNSCDSVYVEYVRHIHSFHKRGTENLPVKQSKIETFVRPLVGKFFTLSAGYCDKLIQLIGKPKESKRLVEEKS